MFHHFQIFLGKNNHQIWFNQISAIYLQYLSWNLLINSLKTRENSSNQFLIFSLVSRKNSSNDLSIAFKLHILFKEENSSNQFSTFSVVSKKKFVKPIFNLFSSFTENSSNDLSIAFNLFFFKTGKFVKSTSNLFSKSTENFVKLNFNFFSL